MIVFRLDSSAFYDELNQSFISRHQLISSHKYAICGIQVYHCALSEWSGIECLPCPW